MIVVVSFWGATEFSIYPAFIFDNYEFLLTSPVTYGLLNTFKYAASPGRSRWRSASRSRISWPSTSAA
jgi:hypothetical protein